MTYSTFHEYFTAQEFANESDLDIKQALHKLASHITEKRYEEVFLLTAEILPNTDYLLRLMKSQTDDFIADDVRLQQFLTWAGKKSTAVNAPYKPAAVRAFYLSIAIDIALDINPYLICALDCVHLRRLASVCNLALISDPYLARDFTLDPNLDLAHKLISDLDLEIELACKLNLNHALQEKLQQLRGQVPKWGDSATFDQWWKTEVQAWTEQLIAVMFHNRNIGHDWQFTATQKELLQQYYDANLLLADCLNSDCNVSREVRQEIEETLLLPIADIKAWNQNKGKL